MTLAALLEGVYLVRATLEDGSSVGASSMQSNCSVNGWKILLDIERRDHCT